jgi:hypothetical protein
VLDTAPDWWETLHLVRCLAADPSSHVAAAVAGWTHPWPFEAWLLADLVDVFIRANSKRGTAKPYPRPNRRPPNRFGGGRSQREIRAALTARGH